MSRRTFMNQNIVLSFDGVIRKAKIIDIEFGSGIGPLFLLETALGNRFWLTREEIKDHEVSK
jgi:hypothetical protein